MYSYQLINGHYIVDVDGTKLLVDTGSLFSFSMISHFQEIAIDGVNYRLQGKPAIVDVEKIVEFVGTKIDGFIGLDIIRQTSLTIYKNGKIDFKAHDVDGKIMNLNTNRFLSFKVSINARSGQFIIDTGAKYGYGMRELFDGLTAYDHVKDYNPVLKALDSDIYHLDVVFDGIKKGVDICDNTRVYSMIEGCRALLIANVTTLFDDVCVINVKKGTLTLK